MWPFREKPQSTFGDRGEDAAVRYLKKRKYRIVARQFRNTIGEIDIIARQGKTIVFVEVKTRRSDSAGQPSEAVTPTKQRQITRVALSWLKDNDWLNRPARFDIIGIIWADDDKSPEIRHFENAFEPVGSGQFFS